MAKKDESSSINCVAYLFDDTVSVDERGNVTYTKIYKLFVDKKLEASTIYKAVLDKGITLPVYGDSIDGIPVSSITLDKWTPEAVKSVSGAAVGRPIVDGSGKPIPGASGSTITIEHAAIWKYTVTYSRKSDRGGSASLGDKAPWEEDYAQNCTLSPKEYTERSCYTLNVTTPSGAAIPYVYQNKKALTNAVGELVYRDANVSNQVLSFDYAVKRYNIDTNHLYVGSVNVSDITVAGIKIPARRGKLLSLVPSVQIWNNKEYTQVHVEIELTVYKSVFEDYLLGNSRWAVPVEEDGTLADDPYPIQLLSCPVSDIKDYKGVKWFSKSRRLGFFGYAKKNNKDRLNPALYSYVTEEYPLKKNGTLYLGTKNSEGRYTLDLNDPNLNKIQLTDSHLVSWSTLEFPQKGFKDTSSGAVQ